MDKLKRFIDCYVDTETCNLRCPYCYITQQRKFNNRLVQFSYPPEYIAKALSRDRLGGTCLFNLCAGGETLLSEDILPVIEALLKEGHYIMVVTNGTLNKRFDEISKFDIEITKHLMFKFSFHYFELKRTNRLDDFFLNIKKMQDCGCSFTVEITPHDELIPYIDKIKAMCEDRLGALCHITIARDDRKKDIPVLSKYSLNDFYNVWKTFNSNLLNFKKDIFGNKRNEFCYAGDWSVYVNLTTGIMKQCYCGISLQNIYKHIEEPLHFLPIGRQCAFPHCYNGHVFLALGDIPELETPTYASLRNRINRDGIEWLQPDMKSFLSCKLNEQNQLYTPLKKAINPLRNLSRRAYNKISSSFSDKKRDSNAK